MDTSTTVLNLTDNSVTRDQYKDALTKLGEFLIQLSIVKGWCSERHRYFSAIYPEYSRYSAPNPDMMNFCPEDIDYGHRLSQVRSRVLWHARHGNIDLTTVNRAFQAMGIPVYGDKPVVAPRFTVYLPIMYVSAQVPGESVDDTRRWVRDNVTRILKEVTDAMVPDENNHLIPGSVNFNTGYVDVEVNHTGTEPEIMPEDTTDPGY